MRSAIDLEKAPGAAKPGDESVQLEAPGEFLSGLLGVLSIELLAFREGEMMTFPSQNAGWRIASPLAGKIHVTAGEKVWPLIAPQAAVTEVGTEMSLLCVEGASVVMIQLQGIAADHVFLHCREEGGLFFERGGLAAERMLHLVSPGAGKQARAKEASEAAYQLLMSLAGTGQAGPRQGRQLSQVVEAALGLIHREYAFLDGISELAERLEVSKEYLIRSFRRQMGATPGDYLNRVRVENAKLLLRNRAYSVQFVSDACGFSNSNYFARVFRARVGMNPSEYAREQRALLPGEVRKQRESEESLYLL